MRTFTYICAHDIEASNPFNAALKTLWDDVRRESGGRLDVVLQPDGAAGEPDDMVDMTIDGRLQIHPVSGMILSRITRVIAVEGMAFAYDSSGHASEAMAGVVGDAVGVEADPQVVDAVRSDLRTKGLHAMRRVMPQGMNQIITRGKPVRGLHDLAGLRVRIGNSPYLKDLYRSLGCDPQPIDLQGVASALREDRAEGLEMIYWAVQSADRHRYLDHVGLVDIRFACFWMCINLDAWNALGEELQTIVERCYERVATAFVGQVDAENERACEFLRSRGYTFTNVDKAELQEQLRATRFYERWREQVGERAWAAVLAVRLPHQKAF